MLLKYRVEMLFSRRVGGVVESWGLGQGAPQTWEQFVLDPLIMLQFWDKIQSLPTTPETAPHVAFTIRNFISMDYTAPQHLATPQVDPLRFQNLDKLATRKKWLPTILRIESKLHTGFPNDHYLLKADIRVKFGAKKHSVRNVFKKLRLLEGKSIYCSF